MQWLSGVSSVSPIYKGENDLCFALNSNLFTWFPIHQEMYQGAVDVVV